MFIDSSVLRRKSLVALTKNKNMDIQRNKNTFVGPQNQKGINRKRWPA